jgi:hypothetical protein
MSPLSGRYPYNPPNLAKFISGCTQKPDKVNIKTCHPCGKTFLQVFLLWLKEILLTLALLSEVLRAFLCEITSNLL